MSHTGVPAIAGLASGVALVAFFAILARTSDTSGSFAGPNYGFHVSVDGLKKTYNAGEKIDFIMRIKGFGNTCTSPGFAIRNVQTLEVIWYSKSAIVIVFGDGFYSASIH